MKVLPCLFQLYSYGGVLEFTILYETSGYSHETHHMSDPDVILQVRFNSPSANTESSLRVVFFVSDLNPGSSKPLHVPLFFNFFSLKTSSL